MVWSQDILHLNSKFKKNAENNQIIYLLVLAPAFERAHTMNVQVLRPQFCVFPWQRSCKPHSASHHFPAFLLMSWPATASPGSRNYSANGISLNTDICVTKGIWTCHDKCRERTLRLGEPQGSIFAPLLNVCVSKSPTANFLLLSLKRRDAV